MTETNPTTTAMPTTNEPVQPPAQIPTPPEQSQAVEITQPAAAEARPEMAPLTVSPAPHQAEPATPVTPTPAAQAPEAPSWRLVSQAFWKPSGTVHRPRTTAFVYSMAALPDYFVLTSRQMPQGSEVPPDFLHGAVVMSKTAGKQQEFITDPTLV